MSKSKTAKTASKNNPTTRETAKAILHEGKKIRPVKLILENRTFFGAEYESGEVINYADGTPMSWKSVVSASVNS